MPAMQELWLQHNQIAQLSLFAPLSALPSLNALFLSPNPLCVDLKTDYRAAVVCTLPSLQVSCCCAVTCTYLAAVARLLACPLHPDTCRPSDACCCCYLPTRQVQEYMLLLASQLLFCADSSETSCYCGLSCCSKDCHTKRYPDIQIIMLPCSLPCRCTMYFLQSTVWLHIKS